jgi:hypothetical protein
MISSCRKDAQGFDWGLTIFLIPFPADPAAGSGFQRCKSPLASCTVFLFILLQGLFLINHLFILPRFVLTICQRHILGNLTTLAPYPTPVIATLPPTHPLRPQLLKPVSHLHLARLHHISVVSPPITSVTSMSSNASSS